ncbi:heterokaryon incompatibility protein-domain-containing protein [Podospora appendiculata]|uniref:Heterokaryon incompatibility protein-domain-containing protein n=1 Tax=Podospora appendiculata TaxID=314037 RepID=A0AAE0X3N6_9PEZI|nr:heterokaryon incompatibility protein-domain-containing protein [Podospora appendiculata]
MPPCSSTSRPSHNRHIPMLSLSPPQSTFLDHMRLVSDLLSSKYQNHYGLVLPQTDRQGEKHVRPASQYFCRTQGNEYGQSQCRGCDAVCELLRWGDVQIRRNHEFRGTSTPRVMHSNYRELDTCAAGATGCDTCKIIRRAFLLEQISGCDAERLRDPDHQWPIYVALDMLPTGNSLIFTVHSPLEALPVFTATVPLSRERTCLPAENPTTRGGRLGADFNELSRVIRNCHKNHECSSKYRWSSRNPPWLLEILHGDFVRLIKGPEQLVEYVVLSYSWGDPTTMPASEWARIKAAGTKSKNRDGIPVPERLRPFSKTELPETMQDAITITKNLGYSYIWIDNVCIPKGTNWDTEAGTMHEVYGNAVFTLAASASTKATDPLLKDRAAWSHRSKACKLREQWLHNTSMPMNDVRLHSPASERAWTLQEERLSPRILYWAAQRWYWSCPEEQITELSALSYPSHLLKGTVASPWSTPHQFLEVCRSGDDAQLHDEWLDIVEAYTRRDLCQPKDRFLAIAGLAVRFYNAKAEISTTSVAATEEYLAGLWRDNLAKHLAWSCATAVHSERNLQHIAPSWSWASLPLRVATRTKHEAFKPAEEFKFLSALPEQEWTDLSTISTGKAVEERGRSVKIIEVQGRFRRFMSSAEDWALVEWADIQHSNPNKSGFDLRAYAGRNVYARNHEDGRVMAKEGHGGEIVGQLDYLAVPEGENGERRGAWLREGEEGELMCLELGELAMLLLQRVEVEGLDGEAYRRVGVCVGYTSRRGFFYGCETRKIFLA